MRKLNRLRFSISLAIASLLVLINVLTYVFPSWQYMDTYKGEPLGSTSRLVLSSFYNTALLAFGIVLIVCILQIINEVLSIILKGEENE